MREEQLMFDDYLISRCWCFQTCKVSSHFPVTNNLSIFRNIAFFIFEFLLSVCSMNSIRVFPSLRSFFAYIAFSAVNLSPVVMLVKKKQGWHTQAIVFVPNPVH
jgi:hypothetical protein